MNKKLVWRRNHKVIEAWFINNWKIGLINNKVESQDEWWQKYSRHFKLIKTRSIWSTGKIDKAKYPHYENTLYKWVLISENVMKITDGVLIETAKKLRQNGNKR